MHTIDIHTKLCRFLRQRKFNLFWAYQNVFDRAWLVFGWLFFVFRPWAYSAVGFGAFFFPGIGLLNGQIQIEFIRSEFSLHAKQNMQAGHGAQHSYT